MIEVVCVCKRRFEVQDEHAGLSIKCPECRRLVSVPDLDPDPVPDTIPPPGLLADSIAKTVSPEAPRTAPAETQAARNAEPVAGPRDAELVSSLEPLIQLGRTIRALLACILAVLVLQLLQGFFRR